MKNHTANHIAALILFFAFCTLTISSSAQAPNWIWAVEGHGDDSNLS
jgi:hypothetical protein